MRFHLICELNNFLLLLVVGWVDFARASGLQQGIFLLELGHLGLQGGNKGVSVVKLGSECVFLLSRLFKLLLQDIRSAIETLQVKDARGWTEAVSAGAAAAHVGHGMRNG